MSETLYGRLLDRFASQSLPPFVLSPFLKAYCKVYGVDTSDLETPFDDYGSFREFFVRPVRTGARTIDTHPDRLTSPVDGEILGSGWFQDRPLQTMRIKGRIYTVEDLVGRSDILDGIRTGAFQLYYLAPGDYHRFHSPTDGTVTGWDYIPGTCHPVNRIGRHLFPEVYVTNRRVVIWMRSALDPQMDVCLVLIGAMGVGRIVVDVDGERSEADGPDERRVRFDRPVPVERGQEIGCFDLGSSALLMWSEDGWRTTLLVEQGPVRLGDPVVSIGARRHDA